MTVCAAGLLFTSVVGAQSLPTTREAIDSKIDVWAEAALKQPEGPTYEFFTKLCPPLRYVDAYFKHYPVLLSAPGSETKSRFVSNGSGINLLARMVTWSNETGTPVEVHVGDTRETFGSDIARLDGPHLEAGYLPIVQVKYRQGEDTFGQEAFASVDEKLSKFGATLVRFDFPAANKNRLDLQLQYDNTLLRAKNGQVLDPDGKVLLCFDENWAWQGARAILMSNEEHPVSCYVAIFTKPIDPADAPKVNAEFFKQEREHAVARWNEILDRGTKIDVPEPYVNNAWRNMITQQYAILMGDHMNYSAMNQYQRQYAHESGEAMRGLLYYGQAETAARTLPPIFDYSRKNIELHDGAFKLMNLADYYFLTRDAKTVKDMREQWQKEIDLIVTKRDKTTGLVPAERYCSDIPTPVVSVSTNASCWRGVRDMAVVLADIAQREDNRSLEGEAPAEPSSGQAKNAARQEARPPSDDYAEQSKKLFAFSKDFRQSILKFINDSWIRESDPPFLPLAPSVEKKPYDPITGTSLGSYWNLVINQFFNADILPYDSKEISDILRYMQTKGGLIMGMIRFQSPRSTWVNTQNLDDLYGVRYALLLQKRDEVDRALVSFYAKLAQGMTRDTFEDGEVTSLVEIDEHGRQISLPPNSHANASFLLQLRYLLVQDWDLDLDGQAETLRLAFATPRAWLKDGQKISITKAPTAFGEVSYTIESKLNSGSIEASIDLPQRSQPKTTLLRFRLPDGKKLASATAGEKQLKISDDGETIDLTGLSGNVKIQAKVK
jgi:hypothetical protein